MKVEVKLIPTNSTTVERNNFIQDNELGIISIYKGSESVESVNWTPNTMEFVSEDGATVAKFPNNEGEAGPSLGFIKRYLEKQGIHEVVLETNDDGSVKVNKNGTVVIRPA